MEDMKDKVGGGKKRADSLLEIHQRELKKKKDVSVKLIDYHLV